MDADALLADLDTDQRAAVATPSLLTAVIAGAGSGKTRVLTRRIAYRIAIDSADARHTLALTFTREAAGELRRRLRRLGLRDHVEAGTFHSVMLSILRQRWSDTDRPSHNILTDRRRVLRDLLDPSARGRLDALVAELDWAASRGISASDYTGAARTARRRPPGGLDAFATLLDAYRREKRRRGVIDFDDVLAQTLHELRRDAAFAEATRWRFRHLLVDEAQDLNPLQHGLLDVLRRGRDDLFLVGDPAQAIFGFNGADPALLVDVDARFAGVEVIRLPVNHRSTPQIVRAGAHVLAHGGDAASLVSDRGDGPPVEMLVADDDVDEATQIAGLLSHVDPDVVRSGQAAVLARTHAQLRTIERALGAVSLPVRNPDGAVSSPLQAAVRTAAYSGSAWRLRAWAHDTLDDHAGQEQSGERRDEEIDGTTVDSADRRRNRAESEALARVASAALDYLRGQPNGDGAGFRSWVATTNPFDDGDSNGVELLTFHAAKGREWYVVVVSGVESSLVPHRTATTAAARSEEARLLYVAMTRATDRLVVTRAARRGGYRRTPSPFIDALDVAEPPPAPPPTTRRHRPPPDRVLAALRTWRDEAARRSNVLPIQLMSDRDIAAIAAARPRTADELEEASSLGPITARRLAPQLAHVIETATATIEQGSALGTPAGGVSPADDDVSRPARR